MSRKAKICIVGGGRIGTVHFQHLLQHSKATVSFVVESDPLRLQEMTSMAQCKGLQSIDELFELMDNNTNNSNNSNNDNDNNNNNNKNDNEKKEKENNKIVDGVIICTPTLTHYELVMKCLNKKVAVFVEKPLSLLPAQIKSAYHLASQNSVPLLTGYQRRFDPNFVEAKKRIDSNAIGKIHIMRSTSRDNPVPTVAFLKTSGGIMHDCGSHDIDLIRWIVGEDPIEVNVMGSCFLPQIKELNDYDTIIAQLKFPNNTLATIDLSRQACYGYDQRIEIHGDNGMIQANNERNTTVIQYNNNGHLMDANKFSFPQRYMKAYSLELDHFIDAILNNNLSLRITGNDVYKVAIIADAATESLKSNKSVKIIYPE